MIPLTRALVLALCATTPCPQEETALDPVGARLSAARDAYANGDLGLSHDLLQTALEEVPGEPAVRLWLGRVLNDLGHGEEAERVLLPAAEANQGSAWLWTELGRAHRLAGQDASAERAFRLAVERNPRFATPRLRLVDLLIEAGRAPEAEALLAPLLARAGDAREVVLIHASLLDALGRPEEAVARLRGALEHPAARLALAGRLARSGRHGEAWAIAEPVLEEAHDPATLVFLAAIARDAGCEVEALAMLGAALVADPTHPGALGTLGELLEHQNAALRLGLTERWVAASPDDAGAWRELLETDLDEGRLEALFRRLDTLPAGTRTALPVRLLEGEALRRAGRSAEARVVLEDLCRAGQPRAWYELGLLEYAAGDFAAGVAAFERGAQGHWAADAHYNRGVCLDRLERFTEAVSAYQAALGERPDLAEAWYQLGADQRYRLGQPDRARESYRRYLELGGDDPEVRRFVGRQP